VADSPRREDPEALVRLKDRALSATAEGITIADARQKDQPIIYANAAFERLTGYRPEYVLGRNCRFLQGPDTDPRTRETIRRAVRRAEPCTVEILNYRQDGTTFWNRLSITPVRNERGEVTHFIGVQSDVTARRRAEEELRATRDELARALQELERDIDLAARVQRAALPRQPPRVDGFHAAWEFLPCTGLAGDFLNVLKLDERRIGLYVLDVSGHGASAALLAVSLGRLMSGVRGQSCLFEADPDTPDEFAITPPADVARFLNTHNPMDQEVTQYFTMVYGILDVPSRELRYVAAGHPGPLVVPWNGEPVGNDSTGVPVGLLEEGAFEEARLVLDPGDRLYLYTDGLTEAAGAEDEEFGAERAAAALSRGRSRTLGSSIADVVSEVRAWRGTADLADDVSVLGVEVS
jgi:sigma-B regulation protein RsbU (phosphoserine phosphatase)